MNTAVLVYSLLYILAVGGDITDRHYTSVQNPTVGVPLENANINIDSVVSKLDCAKRCSSLPLCRWYVTYDYSPVTQLYVCMTSSLPLCMAVVPPGGKLMTGRNIKVMGTIICGHM